MATNVTSSSLTPGAPAPINGPKWASGPYDGLKLPNGQTIGQTDNETLRREFIKIGIIGAATEGRHIIAERYAKLLSQIHSDAGDAAVEAFLQNYRS